MFIRRCLCCCYLWPANQDVTSRVPDARNVIAGVNVIISVQGNDTVNDPSPLGTNSVTESMSNHGVLLNARNPVTWIHIRFVYHDDTIGAQK